MPSQDFDKWSEIAKTIEDPKSLPVPLHIAVGEAVEVAAFVEEHWETSNGVPGLETVHLRLPKETAEELLSLRLAVQEAQTRYLLTVDPAVSHADTIDRAATVLDDLTATIEWVLDDGIDDPADEDLASLGAAHADDTTSADSLAQALHDYATLARELGDRMAGVGGFDTAIIDEAFDLAETLGVVKQINPTRSPEAKAAKRLRDQLAHLLHERMGQVRAAARFVYRGNKALIRQATSAYQRRRRAEARRKAQQTAD